MLPRLHDLHGLHECMLIAKVASLTRLKTKLDTGGWTLVGTNWQQGLRLAVGR